MEKINYIQIHIDKIKDGSYRDPYLSIHRTDQIIELALYLNVTTRKNLVNKLFYFISRITWVTLQSQKIQREILGLKALNLSKEKYAKPLMKYLKPFIEEECWEYPDIDHQDEETLRSTEDIPLKIGILLNYDEPWYIIKCYEYIDDYVNDFEDDDQYEEEHFVSKMLDKYLRSLVDKCVIKIRQ